ncbi:MAG: PhnD/SsuA/transferrin family substrate-binding protein [Betaproteobacteria bacterium]
MIANARMYSVNTAAALAWRELLGWVLQRAGAEPDFDIIEHAAPAPMAALWSREDLGAALMCGLPYSLRVPRPQLIAVPIPSPPRYAGLPRYATDLAVRADSSFATLDDTFGGRIGYTVGDSQSGYFAVRHFLQPYQQRRGGALFREVTGQLLNARGVIDALVSRRIDVGPLDSYSHDLLAHLEPDYARQVRVVATTPWTSIPAFVATANLDAESLSALRHAFVEAAGAPELDRVRATLLLQGFAIPAPDDYAPLRDRHDALSAIPEVW